MTVMTDISEIEMTNTGENTRVIKFNSILVNLTRTDPYGFWGVQFQDGKTPDHLADQQFTGSVPAFQAVKSHLEGLHRIRQKAQGLIK